MALATPRGRFITVEGGEGVGKSLFTASLGQWLRGRSLDLVTTREPGGTPTANRIRALFANPDPEDPLLMKAEALLVSAARAQHVGRLIVPNIERGRWVLCDRFADSTRVYQGALGGLPATELETLIGYSVGDVVPDLTFLLDCDVEVALQRITRRGDQGPDAVGRYDEQTVDFHQRLRRAYLDLAAKFPKRFVKLAAGQAPEKVLADATQILEERFWQA